MCLHSVTKKFEPNKKVRVGYKIVFLENNFTPFRDHWIRSRWDRAFIRPVTTTEGTRYMSGFHAYTSLRGANKVLNALWNKDDLKVVKVLCKDIRYEGIDGTLGTAYPALSRPKNIVADAMRLAPKGSTKKKSRAK